MKNKERQGMRDFRIEAPVNHIIDEGSYLSVVAELPGVEEEKIRINLENNMLTLQWMDSTMKSQKKEILLPCKVRLGNKKFQDGILEVTLEKINTYNRK